MENKFENIKKWRLLNPEKKKAHSKVQNALRRGTLTKMPCEQCGNTKVEAHHKDYEKPLEVVWLCRQCHAKEHRKNPERPKYSANIVLVGDKRRRKDKAFILRYHEIKRLRELGTSYKNIGKITGLSMGTAYKIYNNKTYKKRKL